MATYEKGEPRDTPEEAAQVQQLTKGPDPRAAQTADALFNLPEQPPEVRQSAEPNLFSQDSIKIGGSVPKTPEQLADDERKRQQFGKNEATAKGKLGADRKNLAKPAFEMKQVGKDLEVLQKEQADAQKEILDKQVQPLVDEAEKHQGEYQKAVDARVAYRNKTQQQIEQMDTMAKAIASEQPHDIWTDASVPVKIAGIAAMALGGAAQAIWGDKTNAVADQIELAVKRDLTLQRMRTEKNKDDYANKSLLLCKFMAEGDHMEHSQDKAFSTAMMGIRGRLQAMMPLLKDPQMRAQVNAQIAQGGMKAAQADERVQTMIAGEDFRLAQATAEMSNKLETSNQVSTVAQQNMEIRKQTEARLQKQHDEKMNAKGIPDWEFPSGALGTDAEFGKLRDAESAAKSATLRLKTLSKDLKSGAVNLHSWAGYQQMQRDFAAVTEAAKGAGLVNTGANFTKLEEDLIKNGYMNKVGAIVDPNGAAKLINQKIGELWADVGNKIAERGGTPAETHPYLKSKKRAE